MPLLPTYTTQPRSLGWWHASICSGERRYGGGGGASGGGSGGGGGGRSSRCSCSRGGTGGWSGHCWLWFSRPRTSGILTLLRTKLADFIVKIPLPARRET